MTSQRSYKAARPLRTESERGLHPVATAGLGQHVGNVPFGHTRPQWIVPYGGDVTVDGTPKTQWADYR